MATFEELMEKFRNPGDAGMPDTFADDLAATHAEELSIRDAAVAERENRLAETQKEIELRDKEVTRLKAVNYDLMVAAPKAGEPDNQDTANDNDGDRPRGIDALFE